MFKNIRKLIYISLGTLDKISGQKNNIVIYCYHSISDDDWKYSVSIKNFEKQLRHLLTQRHPVSLVDIEKHIKGFKKINKPSFAITFDDGYSDIFELRKLLKSHNIHTTVFLIKNPKNRNLRELNTKRKLLSSKQVSILKNDGWVFGNHTQTHPVLTRLTVTELAEEVKRDKEKYFCYPKGHYNQKVVNSVKQAGYSMAFSMDDGFIDENTNPFAIPRIGVDGTHSFEEFKVLASPSVVRFRKIINSSFIKKFL